MLRQKLLLLLGSLIVLVLVGGIGAILLLHGLLEDLIQISTASANEPKHLLLIDETLSDLDDQLRELRDGRPADASRLVAAAASLAGLLERVGEPPVVSGDAESSFRRIQQDLLRLGGAVADAVRTDDQRRRTALGSEALTISTELRVGANELGRESQQHRAREHEALVRKFRVTGLAVGVGFLGLLNVSMVVLLRAAMMILRPIDQLVEASRRLAREEFDCRVHVNQHDEFSELAQAYNSLAEQLESNEERKVETLRQVARTLNHELNNAIATIELQLTRLARRSGGEQSLEVPLRQIHETLGRMSQTVGALSHVRRIVLTDYLSGIKMLDLERSVQHEPPTAEGTSDTMTEIKRS